MTAETVREAFAQAAGRLVTTDSFRSMYGNYDVAAYSIRTLDRCTVTGWCERDRTTIVLYDGDGGETRVTLDRASVAATADVIRSLMTLGRRAHLPDPPSRPPQMTEADHWDNLIDRAESRRADR